MGPGAVLMSRVLIRALEPGRAVGQGSRMGCAFRWWAGFAVAVSAAVLVAPASTVRAQPIAVFDGQPVSVSADRLLVDVHKGTAVLTGAVQLRRGELVVQCARVEARYDEAPNITWARATGQVTAQLNDVHARAQEAEIVLAKRVLELRGGVKLWRRGAWIEAQEAQVDLVSGRLTLEQVKGSIPVSSAFPRAAPDPVP